MKCAMCGEQYEPKSEELSCIFCPNCLEIMFTQCLVPNKISAERWLTLEQAFPEEGDLCAAVTTTQAQITADSGQYKQEKIPWMLLSAGGTVGSASKGYEKAAKIFYAHGRYDLALGLLSRLIKMKTSYHTSYCTVPDPLEFCRYYVQKAKCQEQMGELETAQEDLNTAIIYGLLGKPDDKDMLLRDLCRQSGNVYAKMERYNQAYPMMEKALYYAKQVDLRYDTEETKQVVEELREEQIRILIHEALKRNGMEKNCHFGEIED